MPNPKNDSLEYIRQRYQVPAYLNAPIRYRGIETRIVGGDGAYILVRLPGYKRDVRCHPTWEIEYLDGVKCQN